MRCSGVGGVWRCANRLEGTRATAALAAKAKIKRDFTNSSPLLDINLHMRQRGLRADESYWALLVVNADWSVGGTGGASAADRS